ncbi:hypothetical protein B0H63DRAFT_476666 [Podospora didyma]|uniref:DUF7580 domain-containing protein n=1 Tax=Podospora didyma TaxID=330526 RepID=A0AAE0TWC6_9PEZI|nr:hypothetical protein B0H63DRAFT_476666 [Podospora didyma]
MEVAGVVLGAMPIALYALDSYRRCLRVTRDVIKYEGTLETFRLHIFIQKRQLQVTLQNIGLHLNDGQLPTKLELKEHLGRLYPDGHAEFMSILAQMEAIFGKLLEKLDVDPQGKPKWTSESPDRASWNWKRIKRGLGGSEREELVRQLQYWNTALGEVFEKAEIPLDVDGPQVQRLKSRFNLSACNDIRTKARCVYDALARTWQCSCPDHRANLGVSWHLDVDKGPSPLAINILSRDGTWRPVTVDIQEHEVSLATTPNSQSEQEITSPSTLPYTSTESSKKKGKRRVSFWPPSIKRAPAQPPAAMNLAAMSTQLAASPHTLSPSPSIPDTIHVTCVCDFISKCQHAVPGLIEHDDQHSMATRRLILRSIQGLPRPRQPAFLALSDFLAINASSRWSTSAARPSADPPSISRPSGLSRKERFSIAAAATWAVLYLCGTPWLKEEDWSLSAAIQLGVDSEDMSSRQPSISCKFKSMNHESTVSNMRSEQDTNQPLTKIRNKILFALGVLLTELCLNTTLHNLRLESGQDTTQPPSEAETYELAQRQTERVYLDAGQLYGYAVKRCLRCDFPDQDSMQSFDFAQFRRHFFNLVVAPVHATYVVQRL